MPKEIISPAPNSRVELRWGQGGVQIVSNGELGDVDLPEGRTHVGHGDNRIKVSYYGDEQGGEFGGYIEDARGSWIMFFDNADRPLVMWTERDRAGAVEGDPINLAEDGAARTGWFVSLGRADINRLIESLRRARNAVFGKDE